MAESLERADLGAQATMATSEKRGSSHTCKFEARVTISWSSEIWKLWARVRREKQPCLMLKVRVAMAINSDIWPQGQELKRPWPRARRYGSHGCK
ncbi:hypothetical protein NL676_018777 [Syzygium grande]|nr:hypothetical protein NL676_018777 [Syzygium grande]